MISPSNAKAWVWTIFTTTEWSYFRKIWIFKIVGAVFAWLSTQYSGMPWHHDLKKNTYEKKCTRVRSDLLSYFLHMTLNVIGSIFLHKKRKKEIKENKFNWRFGECLFFYIKRPNNVKCHMAQMYLQLPLRQWGASNVYLSVLSSWKVNIAENPITLMGL